METQTHPIQKSVRYLKGIGPRRLEAFKKFGVETLCDLFYFLPRRYEDRSRLKPIRDIRIGEYAVVRGRVIDKSVRPVRHMKVFELFIEDDTSQLAIGWFNQPYLMNAFNEGDEVILSGKVEFRKRLQMTNPEYEIIKGDEANIIQAGRIVPVYPLTEGLAQRAVRISMKELVDQYSEYVEEFMPDDIRKSYNLMGLRDALRAVHFPEDDVTLEQARHRLIFEELFLFELALLRDVALLKKEEHAVSFKNGGTVLPEFREKLPFVLTGDQERVILEMIRDLSHPKPMTRLLQGEVGSGKTVVAILMLLIVARGENQAVFMAPTEVLAEQQYRSVRALLKPFGIRVCLLTGSLPPDQKDKIRTAVSAGSIDVVIGTHAVLQDQVRFKKLSLVVIDEQHKFGVRQRGMLLGYEPRPHLLVMTATPIPRTLGLTLFGDLDVSTIRELPKGRRAVKTYWISEKKQKDIWNFIIEQVIKGKQAYIICPRIDESERTEIKSAVERFDALRKGPLKKVALGLVHGRMTKQEQDAAMEKFGKGHLQVLVSTSIVEVGLDNPNATTMVVLDADRFGLAQLHQMRGRVGRGTDDSFCFLVGDPQNEVGCRRLRILTKTNDGFVIAEEDLKLRGPGDFLGTRQSGVPLFRVAEFPRDVQVLASARKAAQHVVQEDLHFYGDKYARLKERFQQYRALQVDAA